MRVSEEEFAEMQAKRSRWTRGAVVNTDYPAAGVADNTAGFYPADAGSTPARPALSMSGAINTDDSGREDAAVAPRMNSVEQQREPRATYRPAHQCVSGDSASAIPDQTMSGGAHAISAALQAQPVAGTAGRFGPLTSLPRPYERDIIAACLQALELHPRVGWVARQNVGGMQNAAGQYVKFGFKGMSDIFGQLKATEGGRFLAVECKRPGESLTLDQQAFLYRVTACGGVAFVARSVDDVMRALK